MADLFNKHIKKATARTKEKLLEGIGKAKATQDEVFDQHAANLTKQSKACEKLHKDVKIYSQALKALSTAEKQLRDTIREAYEPEWPEREHLTAIFDNLDIQTNELEKVVCEDLTTSVTQYVNQFTELKKKVEKRGRKLVDYDSAKNSYNSTKASSKKGETDPKVAKALTELQQAETMYLDINNELLEILPAVYDSRITFFVDTLQTLFNSNSQYQTEASKFHKQIVTQLDTLGESMDYLRVARPETRAITPIDTASTTSLAGSVALANGGGSNDGTSRQSTPSPPISLQVPSTPQQRLSTDGGSSRPPSQVAVTPGGTKNADSTNPFDDENDHDDQSKDVEEKIENKVYPKLNAQQQAAADQAVAAAKKNSKDSNNPFDEDEEDEKTAKADDVKKEDQNEETAEEKKEESPKPLEGVTKEKRKTLYFVKSTHDYKAVDTDELSFGPGLEIKVLESSESDQLDEGWQLGELPDGKRGVFPENFTKKL